LICITGFTGGVWLVVWGHWGLLVIGVLMVLVMPYAYLLLSLPKMRTIPRLIRQLEKEKTRSTMLLGFINVLIDYALIAVWVFIVFGIFIRTDRVLSSSFIPFLLWGYCVLMAPLVYMVSKEHPSPIGAKGGLLFALLGFGGLTVCQCVSAPFRVAAFVLFLLLIAFPVFQMGIVRKATVKEEMSLEGH
jgi:hypothetical protein